MSSTIRKILSKVNTILSQNESEQELELVRRKKEKEQEQEKELALFLKCIKKENSLERQKIFDLYDFLDHIKSEQYTICMERPWFFELCETKTQEVPDAKRIKLQDYGQLLQKYYTLEEYAELINFLKSIMDQSIHTKLQVVVTLGKHRDDDNEVVFYDSHPAFDKLVYTKEMNPSLPFEIVDTRFEEQAFYQAKQQKYSFDPITEIATVRVELDVIAFSLPVQS
jgi:hypothetical protein